MSRIALSFAVMFIVPCALAAQGAPGTNLTVHPQVSSITMSGDTVQIDFLVLNLATSAESLFTFTINAPSPILAINTPSPDTAWLAGTSYRDRSVGTWGALGSSIPPGSVTPVLSFAARGLPAIDSAWAQGHYPPPFLDDTSSTPPDTTDTSGESDPLASNAVVLHAVGIDPIPLGSTVSSLTARLDALTTQACQLGWIDETTVCTDLHAALSTDNLQQFSVALAAGHGLSGPVDDNAYWLLKTNVDYIIGLNPPVDMDGIRLTYICGNKFRVRNPNPFSVPVTWDVYNQGDSGALSLPPTSTGQPYSETYFTTTATGTVRLFYNAQLIETKANGGFTCP